MGRRTIVKLIFCLRRLPSLSPEAFRRYWLEQHGPLVRSHADALNIRRYVQSHGFEVPGGFPAATARGCAVPAYDGVAELWWDSMESMAAPGTTPEGRAAGRALLEDERKFLDLPNCTLFVSEEQEVISAA